MLVCYLPPPTLKIDIFPLIWCNILFCRYIFIVGLQCRENISSICVLYTSYLLVLSKYLFFVDYKSVKIHFAPSGKTQTNIQQKNRFQFYIIVCDIVAFVTLFYSVYMFYSVYSVVMYLYALIVFI